MTPGRVRVFEEWTTQGALEGHFKDDSYWAMRRHLEGAGIRASDVKKYRFDLAERVYDAQGQPRAAFFPGEAAS